MKAGLPAFKQLADTTGAVANDLGQAKTSASGVTDQLDAAIAKLSAMTTGKNDPAYAAAMGELTQARSNAAGLGTTLDATAPKATTAAALLGAAISSQGTQRSAGLNQLSAGSTALASGIAQVRQSGNSQLAAGIDKLGRRRQAVDQRPECPDRRRGCAGGRARPAHQWCRPTRDGPERRHGTDRQADQRPWRHAGQGAQVRRIAAFGEGPRAAPA